MDPATVFAVKLIVLPAQTGELLPAVAVGNALTATETEDATEGQLLLVIVKEYVTAEAVVDGKIKGFCILLVNPFGPDQL